MSLSRSLARAAAFGVALALASGLSLAPAHSQGFSQEQAPDAGAETRAGASPAWVKLCERGKLRAKDNQGGDAAKDGRCTTLTEQIHPQTGMVMIGVRLEQVAQRGSEKHTLAVTVPKGVATERGSAITVFPPDLWEKIMRNEKLRDTDQTRLVARTVKLAFRQCGPTDCTAEAEATPLLIDMMKDNAGLLVHTIRLPGTPVSQPVSLAGFAQALEGPPIDTRAFKAAREKLMREIRARQKARP